MSQSGNNGKVSVGGSVVTKVADFSFDESANTIPTSVLGDTAETHVAGRTNWEASITCNWDPADTTGQEAMTIGSEVTIEFQPEGDTTGDMNATGTGTITARGTAVADESVISQTFSVQGNGVLTRGTVA